MNRMLGTRRNRSARRNKEEGKRRDSFVVLTWHRPWRRPWIWPPSWRIGAASRSAAVRSARGGANPARGRAKRGRIEGELPAWRPGTGGRGKGQAREATDAAGRRAGQAQGIRRKAWPKGISAIPPEHRGPAPASQFEFPYPPGLSLTAAPSAAPTDKRGQKRTGPGRHPVLPYDG